MLRVSYNGNTPASQAGDEGSIPSTRIKKKRKEKKDIQLKHSRNTIEIQ